MHARLTQRPLRFEVQEFTLDAVANAGTTFANGVTISGLSANDRLIVELLPGSGWFEAVLWRARFKVRDAALNVTDHYASCSGASAAAALALAVAEGPQELTGSTSYTFQIPDTFLGDNLGELNLKVTIIKG